MDRHPWRHWGRLCGRVGRVLWVTVVAAVLSAPEARAQATAQTWARGLAYPWALAFLPDGRALISERAGQLRVIQAQGQVSASLGGLPKVAKFSGEMLSLGWLEFTGFAALISINLAFINLLPIPTLDGGHLAIYAAEAVRRKPLGIRSQELAFRLGMAFVLAFAVFVTVNDLAQMFL